MTTPAELEPLPAGAGAAPARGGAIRAEHGVPLPGGLTRDPDKAALFAADPWFRDGWEDLVRLAGGVPGARAVAQRHALVLLKPDAVVRHGAAAAIAWLAERGAQVVYATQVGLGRAELRTMWQYQLGASTRDRRDLADALLEAGASLLVLLRLPAEPEHGGVPATVRVSGWKGPADPARRREGQLRSVLGGGNFLLNYVHAADEPADLARELAILLDGPRRAAAIGALTGEDPAAGDELAAALALAEAMQASVPRHDLSPATALRGLEAALAAASGTAGGAARAPGDDEANGATTAAAGRARAGLAAVARGAQADWRALLADLDAAGARTARWDRIVLGTTLMAHTEPGVEQVLGSAARSWWDEETGA